MGLHNSWATAPVEYRLLSLTILCLGVYICFTPLSKVEGFVGQDRKAFSTASGGEVYDTLYASMYDSLFTRKERVVHEFNTLFEKTDVGKGAMVLDVGSGTGHFCGLLAADHIRCTGMDQSMAMLTKARERYPGVKFVQANAALPSYSYYNTFDVVTCFYFTFAEMTDKQQFLTNAYHWLKPGGKLLLHLADPSKLDPILPVGNVLISVDPQNFSKKKITTTRAVFKNKDYKSDLKEQANDKFLFVETITDKHTGKTRRLERTLVMLPEAAVSAMASSTGFVP